MLLRLADPLSQKLDPKPSGFTLKAAISVWRELRDFLPKLDLQGKDLTAPKVLIQSPIPDRSIQVLVLELKPPEEALLTPEKVEGLQLQGLFRREQEFFEGAGPLVSPSRSGLVGRAQDGVCCQELRRLHLVGSDSRLCFCNGESGMAGERERVPLPSGKRCKLSGLARPASPLL